MIYFAIYTKYIRSILQMLIREQVIIKLCILSINRLNCRIGYIMIILM